MATKTPSCTKAPGKASQDGSQITAPSLAGQYRQVRRMTERLCERLTAEDCAIQSMPDVSPAKWHLAHSSWFFDVLVLAEVLKNYEPFDSRYHYLFNSYYNTLGEQFDRPRRGVLSRPSLEDIGRYRQFVDQRILAFAANADQATLAKAAPIIILGLNHEQQHQELILTDIKHVFWSNPLRPAYRDLPESPRGRQPSLEWISFPEDTYEIGCQRSSAREGFFGTETDREGILDSAFGRFAYDNEGPAHKVHLGAFRIASRLVTNGEFLRFIEDGGYGRPELWLSDGWKTVQARRWQAPLYWEHRDGHWWLMTLAGMRKVNPDEPVCHVSFYEADAFARWAGARLPTEAEWEIAAADYPIEGNLLESGHLHPMALVTDCGQEISPVENRCHSETPVLRQMFGDVWEWTASPYRPYPGYRPPAGAPGEYNAKFMCNQMVLRGGSFATPRSHIRSTYRNFFPPDARWQFMGLRLAEDAES